MRPPAWAWGRLGHRVIAKLAERHLSDQAKPQIKALLEPGESLAACSTWADEHRRVLPRTAHWHYVDVPLDEPRYDDRITRAQPNEGRWLADLVAMDTPEAQKGSVEDRAPESLLADRLAYQDPVTGQNPRRCSAGSGRDGMRSQGPRWRKARPPTITSSRATRLPIPSIAPKNPRRRSLDS